MASSARGSGSGKIKNPNPSRVDVVFYTVWFFCEALLYLPIVLLVLLYLLATVGPKGSWYFAVSSYRSWLYGNDGYGR